MNGGVGPEDVARLRIALGRISRFLDRHARGDRFTQTDTSVLASAVRLAPIRLSELADVKGRRAAELRTALTALESPADELAPGTENT